ncbi:MAG: hypothetical protein ACK4JE_01895, partial [Endomicrobiia bacterium]
MTDFLGTLGLLCALINFFVGISLLISLKKTTEIRNKSLHYTIILFSFIGGLWCFFRGIQLLLPIEFSLLLERINLTIALFLLSTAIIFAYYLLGETLKWKTIIYIYIPVFIFGTIGFTNFGIKEVISVFPLKRITGIGYKFCSAWITFSL